MKTASILAFTFALSTGCAPLKPPDPSAVLDTVLTADPPGLGWACFDNDAVLGDSGCARSLVECRMIAKARATAYAERDVPFQPSSCAFIRAPICFAFQDADLQWSYFRCFKSMERCQVGLQNLPAGNEPLSACREIKGDELVPPRSRHDEPMTQQDASR
jgi:hypothetical protein